MDSPEMEMIHKVNDVHTKLAIFFANYLIEIEARLMALELTIAELGQLDQKGFAKELAQQYTAMHTIAQSQFAQRLADDPDLAWLGAQIRTDTVQ